MHFSKTKGNTDLNRTSKQRVSKLGRVYTQLFSQCLLITQRMLVQVDLVRMEERVTQLEIKLMNVNVPLDIMGKTVKKV